MSQEVTNHGYVDFPALVNIELSRQEQGKPVSPIGAIVFARNSRLVLMGESPDGKLQSAYINAPSNFNVDGFFGWRGRILEMNDFDEVAVAQIPLDTAKIGTYRSIRTRASVSVRIPFFNPISKKDEYLITSEEELLKVFTGEGGGFAIFDGADLPEENALVLEKRAGEARFGLVFFFHPTENNLGLDSGTGLFVFLSRLNEQFADQDGGQLQKKALEALEKDIKAGTLNLSHVRLELFKAQIIAHARLAESTDEPRYYDFLKSNLSGFEPNFWSRMISNLRGELSEQARRAALDRSIDKVLIGGTIHRVVDEENTSQIELIPEAPILSRIKTERIKSLRESFGGEFKKNELTHSYLSKLVDLILQVYTDDEFEDIDMLLQEINNSPYKDERIWYDLNWRKATNRLWIWNSYWAGFNYWLFSSGQIKRDRADHLITLLRAGAMEMRDNKLYSFTRKR